ncbi:MAG: glycosyltransferase family 4 protein [Kofleriaceae bacterium]
MKMCAALARRGHEVVLVAKAGSEKIRSDDHSFYGVEPRFDVHKVARPKVRGGAIVYSVGLASCVAKYRNWADIAYCRDPVGALVASYARIPVVFEAHEIPRSPLLQRLVRQVLRSSSSVGTVAISNALRDDLVRARLHHPQRPIVVAHDASDPPPDRRIRACRGTGAPVIGYVGSLYPGRGVETIIAVADGMPRYKFRVVGGSQEDLERWRRRDVPHNVELVGFVPPSQLPEIYGEFDIVVMPYASRGVTGPSGGSDTSKWASPMKMFEYMASGVPIITSDLPVLQEVLRDGHNALIVRAESVEEWQAAIERLIREPTLRTELANNALADLMRAHTWDARARSVLNALNLEDERFGGRAGQLNGDA